jgi:hypothetical protein
MSINFLTCFLITFDTLKMILISLTKVKTTEDALAFKCESHNAFELIAYFHQSK